MGEARLLPCAVLRELCTVRDSHTLLIWSALLKVVILSVCVIYPHFCSNTLYSLSVQLRVCLLSSGNQWAKVVTQLMCARFSVGAHSPGCVPSPSLGSCGFPNWTEFETSTNQSLRNSLARDVNKDMPIYFNRLPADPSRFYIPHIDGTSH